MPILLSAAPSLQPRPCSGRQVWPWWLLIVLVAAGPGSVEAAPLEGAWRQTFLQQAYRFAATWSSEDCPPRPPDRRSTQQREYQATVRAEGYQLQSGREVFGSHRCLSSNPSLIMRSYDPGTWTTHCSTPEAAATREEVRHRLQFRSDDVLEVVGESHYFWILKGSSCEAWMTEIRRFDRVILPTAPAPPSVELPSTTTEPTAATAVVESPASAPSLLPASQPSPVRAGGGRLEVILTEGTEGTASSAVVRRAGSTMTSRKRIDTGMAWGGGWILLVVGLSLLLLLIGGGAILFGWRRVGRRVPNTRTPASAMPTELQAPPGWQPLPADALVTPVPRSLVDPELPPVPASRPICPHCHREAPPAARFCPFDGQSLSAGADPEPALASQGRVCPLCQAEFDDPLLDHCPQDGATLVSILRSQPHPVTRLPADVYKECPRCGARFPVEQSFCGLDGQPLVLRH